MLSEGLGRGSGGGGELPGRRVSCVLVCRGVTRTPTERARRARALNARGHGTCMHTHHARVRLSKTVCALLFDKARFLVSIVTKWAPSNREVCSQRSNIISCRLREVEGYVSSTLQPSSVQGPHVALASAETERIVEGRRSSLQE